MLQKLIERRQKGSEEGFTLIELMVVVLIIAILIAIAIPTFLGARQRAQDRSAQSNDRNAFTAAKTVFTDSDAYPASASAVGAVEPSLTFTDDTAPTSGKNISYVQVNANTMVVGTKSDSGECFYIKDVSGPTSGGTTYAKSGASPCPLPDDAALTFGGSW